MDQVMMGALAMGFAVAALFFLRFWNETRDRLFAFFSLAFLVLAINRVVLALDSWQGEQGDYVYWVRLTAFALILLAILDKNRKRGHSPQKIAQPE